MAYDIERERRRGRRAVWRIRVLPGIVAQLAKKRTREEREFHEYLASAMEDWVDEQRGRSYASLAQGGSPAMHTDRVYNLVNWKRMDSPELRTVIRVVAAMGMRLRLDPVPKPKR